jgi:adenylate cyclase class 2
MKKTPTEIEVKLRIANLPGILTRLKAIGALSHGRVLERNTLFDTANSDFRRTGRLLRVRIETPAPTGEQLGGRANSILTFKSPPAAKSKSGSTTGSRHKARYKERAENELPIQHPAKVVSILRSLGLRPTFRYEKFRTTFRLRGLHLDLDETPVGIILELEGQPKAIDRAAKALGFAPSEFIRATYWDLYVADCRRRGVTPKNMLLPTQKSR